MAKECKKHELIVHTVVRLDDGRQPMTVYCFHCGRQWQCESINFAPMGAKPIWTFAEEYRD